MEDTKDVDMSPGQDQARGEMLGSPISTNHEDGVIIQDKDVVSSRKLDRSKKAKESAPKEAARSKVTVPHPFSLATDKRMSLERWHSVDLLPSKEKQTPTARVRRGLVDLTAKQTPKLSKSVSCVNKAQSPPHISKARSKKENCNGPVVNSKVTKRSLTTRNKQTQIKVKQGGDATGTNQLGKNPTFKALPLPSFYHRTDPISKLDVASKRSPQGDKLKKWDISNGAQETIITKLIKSTRRALNPNKETVKSVVAVA